MLLVDVIPEESASSIRRKLAPPTAGLSENFIHRTLLFGMDTLSGTFRKKLVTDEVSVSNKATSIRRSKEYLTAD
jgi:hypothetical protein